MEGIRLTPLGTVGTEYPRAAHTRDVGQDTGDAVNWGVWAGGGSLLSVAPATTSEGTPPIGALMGQRPQGLHRHTHRQSSQNGARDVCLCAFVTCKFHFETNKIGRAHV